MRHISELIVRMAQDNPSWGYTRIQGALANLSHKVGRGTIANVLERDGIEPSPLRSRRTPWSTFLRAHWKALAASDFLTVEVWTGRGLVDHDGFAIEFFICICKHCLCHYHLYQIGECFRLLRTMNANGHIAK